MVDLLLDGSGREQTINGDLLLLPDAPRPLLGLLVRARVPIRVEEYDSGPKTKRLSGEQRERNVIASNPIGFLSMRAELFQPPGNFMANVKNGLFERT